MPKPSKLDVRLVGRKVAERFAAIAPSAPDVCGCQCHDEEAGSICDDCAALDKECPHSAPKRAETVSEIRDAQDWNDETLLILVLGYLDDEGFSPALVAHLRKCADEENAAAAEYMANLTA